MRVRYLIKKAMASALSGGRRKRESETKSGGRREKSGGRRERG
jgi:hypothetical protein